MTRPTDQPPSRGDERPPLEPAATLLRRLRAELSAEFSPDRPIYVGQGAGRLDVMGGIAHYTGSLVCATPLDRAAAVAVQRRDDRQLQIFSFNLLDEHLPFTLRMPLSALATHGPQVLGREFAEPGRQWAGYPAGCLLALHEAKLVDLNAPATGGLSLAIYGTVPMRVGAGSSSAMMVATLAALRDHFDLGDALEPMRLALLCRRAEEALVGTSDGLADALTGHIGQSRTLLRLFCQPHELRPPLPLPEGIRLVGINSAVRDAGHGARYMRTRCAAFMGHRIILDKMRQLGQAAGKEMFGDPMAGYLANLALDDYKTYFRGYLPESIAGLDFLRQYGPTIDTATQVNPTTDYHVRQATDHHVHEASRVRNFVGFLEQAGKLPRGDERRKLLNMAGHLMYASNVACCIDAELGSDQCELLVELVRKNELAGLYGARITGRGAGGTVAVLCNDTPRAQEMLERILGMYREQTGLPAELLQCA